MIPYTTVVSFSLSINSSSFLQPYDTATAAGQCYLLSKLPTSQSRKYCIAQCFCQSNSLLLLYQMYMDSVALYPNLYPNLPKQNIVHWNHLLLAHEEKSFCFRNHKININNFSFYIRKSQQKSKGTSRLKSSLNFMQVLFYF